MAVTSLEEGLLTRTEDLKKLWDDTMSVRVPFTDVRRTKIENYLAEIPMRVRRREGYEALFALTRIATMLGEIRIEFKDAPNIEVGDVNGTDEGDTEKRAVEEAPTDIRSAQHRTPKPHR